MPAAKWMFDRNYTVRFVPRTDITGALIALYVPDLVFITARLRHQRTRLASCISALGLGYDFAPFL